MLCEAAAWLVAVTATLHVLHVRRAARHAAVARQGRRAAIAPGVAATADTTPPRVDAATLGAAVESAGGHWAYKGEGNSNVVFEYVGPGDVAHTVLVGTVLRITKRHVDAPSSAPTTPRASPAHTARSRSTTTTATVAVPTPLFPEDPLEYRSTVIAPLVGHRYVPPDVEVPLSEAFLAGLQDVLEAAAQRPLSRVGGVVDAALRRGVVMLDYTRIQLPGRLERKMQEHIGRGSASGRSAAAERERGDIGIAITSSWAATTMCAELKPKCGVLPAAPGLTQPVKYDMCRYCMHQVLKLSSGKVQRPSAYCPLDLYSGRGWRIRRALHALLDTPQNNLRLFRDGAAVFTDAHLREAARDVLAHRALLNHVLQGTPFDVAARDAKDGGAERAASGAAHVTPGEGAGARASLIRLLSTILQREPVLDALARVQRLDRHDIEGIWPVYEALQRSGEALTPSHAWYADVRDFLLAATAKDASVMVATRLVPSSVAQDAVDALRHARARLSTADDAHDACVGYVHASDRMLAPAGGDHDDDDSGDNPSGRSGSAGAGGASGGASTDSEWAFLYSVAVVDTDPKPHSRIPRYIRLDRQVVEAFEASPAAAARRGLASCRLRHVRHIAHEAVV